MTMPDKVPRRTDLVTVSFDSAVVNHPAAQSAGLRALVSFLSEATGIDRHTLLSATPYRGRLPTPEDIHAILEHPALAGHPRAARGPLADIVAQGMAVFRRERQRVLECYRGVPKALSTIRTRLDGGSSKASTGGGLLLLSQLPAPVLRHHLTTLGLDGIADAAYSLTLADASRPQGTQGTAGKEEPTEEGATPIRDIATVSPGLTASLLRDMCGLHGTRCANAILITGRLAPDLTASRAAGMRTVLCRFNRPATPSKIQDINLAHDWSFEAARKHASRTGDLSEPYAVVRSASELTTLPCFSGTGRPPPTGRTAIRLAVTNRPKDGR